MIQNKNKPNWWAIPAKLYKAPAIRQIKREEKEGCIYSVEKMSDGLIP